MGFSYICKGDIKTEKDPSIKACSLPKGESWIPKFLLTKVFTQRLHSIPSQFITYCKSSENNLKATEGNIKFCLETSLRCLGETTICSNNFVIVVYVILEIHIHCVCDVYIISQYMLRTIIWFCRSPPALALSY